MTYSKRSYKNINHRRTFTTYSPKDLPENPEEYVKGFLEKKVVPVGDIWKSKTYKVEKPKGEFILLKMGDQLYKAIIVPYNPQSQ